LSSLKGYSYLGLYSCFSQLPQSLPHTSQVPCLHHASVYQKIHAKDTVPRIFISGLTISKSDGVLAFIPDFTGSLFLTFNFQRNKLMGVVAMLLHSTLQNVLNNKRFCPTIPHRTYSSLIITILSLFSLHVTVIISSYE